MGNDVSPSISSIGHLAYETLSTSQRARVSGITSKGIFAITGQRRVIFFSTERYKGPLTANLSHTIPDQQSIIIDSRLSFSPSQVRFDHSGFVLKIDSQINIWKPEIQIRPDTDLQVLKDRAAHMQAHISKINRNHEEFTQYREQVITALSASEKDTLNQLIIEILGNGTGLTPSGDDFICGLLLAAHTWDGILKAASQVKEIEQNILDHAWEQTTTLSANLIKSAAHGSADERIIACLNWLNGGIGDIANIIEELRSYGSSSGIDTLFGMLSLILASAG
jgi:hypothetical protein